MGLVAKIEGVIEVVNELSALKTALGLPDSTAIADVIAEIKSLAAAVATLGTATAAVVPATEVVEPTAEAAQ
jgi:hypothetical protein